jgi:hypothetical protein
MQQILQEQEFQLSGACDSATCLAQTGRIMGVSKIVAATITNVSKNGYAVSVKMVDVQTGQLVVTATEEHEGGVFEANQRMLRNLATVLAGKPNQDHLDYVKEQEKLLAEQKSSEAGKSHRFRFAIEGSGFYQFNVLEPDAEAKKRAYFDSDPHLMSYAVPKNSVDPAVMLTAAYRFHDRWWVHLLASYLKTRVRETMAVDTFFVDSTIPAGSDTSHLLGRNFLNSKSFAAYDMVDAGIGLDAELFRTARMKIVLSLTPMAGWTFLSGTTYDSSRIDAAISVNGSQLGKYEYFEQVIGKGTLSSLSLGAKAAVNAEYSLTRNWAIFGGFDLAWQEALALWGTYHMNRHTVETWPGTSTSADSSWLETRAAMKGDFLGTGEYVQMTNPDVHQTKPNGSPVGAWRSFKELADFRFGIGIAYYF